MNKYKVGEIYTFHQKEGVFPSFTYIVTENQGDLISYKSVDGEDYRIFSIDSLMAKNSLPVSEKQAIVYKVLYANKI